MNYKLINRITNEETICEKTIVDGFDYYINSDSYVKGDYLIDVLDNNLIEKVEVEFGDCCYEEFKVIATNNPNIDLPKVIDEVEELAKEHIIMHDLFNPTYIKNRFKAGYNKSQETHPNSNEDMIEFGIWLMGNHELKDNYDDLLEIWKSQQIKTLYYE